MLLEDFLDKMADITITGNQAYFNEDVKFFKDVYIYGTLYYDFESYPGILKFRDVSIKNLSVINVIDGTTNKAILASDIEFDGTNQLVYQVSNNNTNLLPNGDPGQLLQSNGTSVPTWVNAPSVGIGSTGLTVTEDNTNTTRYIGFVTTTSGISSVFANQNLTVNPSSKIVGINTNNLTNTALVGSAASARGLYISNGMIIMDNSLNSNSYIGTNYNALMVGPVLINNVITIDGNLAVV